MSNNYSIEQKKNTHLYFQVGPNKYAINTTNILEIMKMPALDYPQKLPNNIIGLLKYNNFVINVVDIRCYLNIEVTPYNTNNELLIVKTDEVIMGIITDKIIGILPFDSSYIDQIPFTDDKMIIESLYKYNDDTIFIIDIYALENLLKNHSDTPSDFNIAALFPQDEYSKKIMAKRTKAVSDKSSLMIATSELHVKNKYISCNLGKDYYCIKLDYVKEVLKDTNITHVPNTPDCIEGIMNLRGDYITVINLKKLLSLPVNDSIEKKPVIIIECNELQLAFLFDNINELFDCQDNALTEKQDSYYSYEFIHNQKLYTMLNVEKIVSDKKIVVTDM